MPKRGKKYLDAVKKVNAKVKHDFDEAVKMADKIAIFKDGAIEQYDSPDNVLAHPANAFVADFVGADRTLKRLRLVTVEEVTDADVPSVSRHAKAKDALSALQSSDSSVVIVIDGDHRPVGYVTEQMLEGASGIVQDLARPLPAMVPHHADLRAVVSEMFANDVMWLTCVDDGGRYTGVVTQPAVTSALGETYRKSTNGAA
jgi:osmoprotectant transport system ATP-binding protein